MKLIEKDVAYKSNSVSQRTLRNIHNANGKPAEYILEKKSGPYVIFNPFKIRNGSPCTVFCDAGTDARRLNTSTEAGFFSGFFLVSPR